MQYSGFWSGEQAGQVSLIDLSKTLAESNSETSAEGHRPFRRLWLSLLLLWRLFTTRSAGCGESPGEPLAGAGLPKPYCIYSRITCPSAGVHAVLLLIAGLRACPSQAKFSNKGMGSFNNSTTGSHWEGCPGRQQLTRKIIHCNRRNSMSTMQNRSLLGRLRFTACSPFRLKATNICVQPQWRRRWKYAKWKKGRWCHHLCRRSWRWRQFVRPQMGTWRWRGQPCMGSPLHEDGKSHDEACNRQEAQALTGIPDP